MEIFVVYDEPLDGDVEQGKCDRAGRIDRTLLREWTPFREAEFYFCGPKPFMRSIYADLTELGVEDARINFEFFGPKESIMIPAETL